MELKDTKIIVGISINDFKKLKKKHLTFSKMKKTKVTISLKEGIWKKYQQFCKENDLIPSYEIQRFMKKELK